MWESVPTFQTTLLNNMATSTKLLTRPLGKDGPQVPRLGIGTMGLSGVYGDPAPDKERLAFLDEVYKRGEIFWDTGKCSLAVPFYPCSCPTAGNRI
jgi:hypothetical protein